MTSADRPRAPRNRDALLGEFMAADGKPTHDEIVARIQAANSVNTDHGRFQIEVANA